jgi:small GTP-binding protein
MKSGKVVLIGPSGSGKTAFCMKAKHNNVPTQISATIGCDFFAVIKEINNEEIKLLVWDTAGQEVYRTFTPQFTRNAVIVLLFDSLTNPQQDYELESWMKYLDKDSLIIVVPSKCDLCKNVPEHIKFDTQGRELVYAKPISSTKNINIDSLLEQIASILYEKTKVKKSCIWVDRTEAKNDSCCKI